jgi:hypothetical protein
MRTARFLLAIVIVAVTLLGTNFAVDVRPNTTKHRSSAIHYKPVPKHKARQAKMHTMNSLRSDTLRSVTPLQMASRAAINTPKQAVSRRSQSVLPSAVSVNGQQRKNSRSPGARLTASGGPATIARGTAAINGTDMKRKP